MSGSYPLVSLALVLSLPFGGAAPEPDTLAVTADGEGHVHPCENCPGQKGLGGLTRRATIVNELRQQTPDLLLLDAGNALFGDESVASGGAVIVRAYEQLGYIALNVSYRDFRLGADATLALAASSKVPFLSANLLDTESGEPLFKPFEICQVGTRRVAVIGLTTRPASLDSLPHLSLQLTGVRIADPLETLAALLPRARDSSDEIVLLYYGTIPELKKIDQRFSEDLSAIALGGRRQAEVPRNASVPVVASMNHGRALSILETSAGEPATVRVQHIVPETVPNPAMEETLSAFPVFADRRTGNQDR